MRNDDRSDDRPTLFELLGQVVDLCAGLGILLLPLLATALPGVILMLVLPAALLVGAVAVPLVIVGALLAPPYLLVRGVRRGLRR
jgi:hypothetical protein